jgi:hypothetical protein
MNTSDAYSIKDTSTRWAGSSLLTVMAKSTLLELLIGLTSLTLFTHGGISKSLRLQRLEHTTH